MKKAVRTVGTYTCYTKVTLYETIWIPLKFVFDNICKDMFINLFEEHIKQTKCIRVKSVCLK